MRLSATLNLALLSACHDFSVSASMVKKRDTFRLQRMLQKNEAGDVTAQRVLQGNGKNGKNGEGGGGGGGGGSGPSPKPKGIDGRGKPSSDHTAHLDANDGGITTDAVEYVYGTPIGVSFELTNDLIEADVLATLNMENMDQWTVGLFMRMADPQGGALSPIVSVTPTITDAVRRELQEMTGTSSTEAAGTTIATTTTPEEVEREPVNLNHVGTAAVTTTGADVLDPNTYGTGFDVYLLDENGARIIGPGTFYMIKTQAMVDEEEAKKNAIPNHPLAKFDHSAKKKKGAANGKGGGKGNGKGGGKGITGTGKPDWGKGTGKDGGMIIGTTESLADYILETDLVDYAMGDSVTVTYDLSPDLISSGRRRSLQGQAKGGVNKEGEGGNNGGVKNPFSTTGSTKANDPTTTTSTEPDIDMGAGDIPGAGLDPQPEDTISPDDVTLFKMGVYMRMAHPQEGALDPIFSIPFCVDPTNCGKTVEELEAGTFSFSTNQLDVKKYGGGFDVWILNGVGHGMAGPYTFYIH